MSFTVIDNKTGKEPDCEKIALTEARLDETIREARDARVMEQSRRIIGENEELERLRGELSRVYRTALDYADRLILREEKKGIAYNE